MTDRFATMVEELTRIPGARGALIVDVEAGVSVSSELADEVKETALAALTGSLFRRTSDASRGTGYGRLRVLQLEATGGHLVVVGAGPLLVAVLAGPAAQLGLVRVQAARAAEELMQ